LLGAAGADEAVRCSLVTDSRRALPAADQVCDPAHPFVGELERCQVRFQRSCLAADEQCARGKVSVAARVERAHTTRRVLLAACKRRPQHRQHAAARGHLKRVGGMRRAADLRPLRAAALGHDAAQRVRVAAHLLLGGGLDAEAVLGDAAERAQHVKRVVTEGVLGDGADAPHARVGVAAVRVAQQPVREAQRHRVGGEVAPREVLLDRQRRLAHHAPVVVRVAAVALLAFQDRRLGARQRDLDLAAFRVAVAQHREGIAGRLLLAAERAQTLGQQAKRRVVGGLAGPLAGASSSRATRSTSLGRPPRAQSRTTPPTAYSSARPVSVRAAARTLGSASAAARTREASSASSRAEGAGAAAGAALGRAALPRAMPRR
jgi:hypothetical protein